MFDNFPVDRVLWALKKGEEPTDLVALGDDLKLTDETKVIEIYKEAFTNL